MLFFFSRITVDARKTSKPAGVCSLLRREGAMSISKTRGFLYWLARLLGDVNAVKKGKVGRRVGRRIAGKVSGRGLRKLFK